MSTAAATEAPPRPAKGKKKLIIIIAAAVLVLAGGGAGAYFLLKKKAGNPELEGEDGAPPATAAAAKHESKNAPVFVPLDPFTVNLADREAERYAQVGITLEIEDAHVGEEIKLYMPAIRNRILMAIADRTAGELMGREGKALLAETVRRETSLAIGFEPEAGDGAAADADPKGDKPARKSRKKAEAPMPIKAVHFSNFIIQ
jgi:flagellar FliL protein